MVIGGGFLYPHHYTSPFPICRASYVNMTNRISISTFRDFIRNNTISL